MNDVSQNISAVRHVISRVCGECGRDVSQVTLVAVSKMQSADKIHEALRAGQRVFGENRVQEARERWGELKKEYPDITLHLIGPLQTNKVRDAVALFDVIETIDRPEIARAVSKEMKKQNRVLPCFVQVNTGAEEQKAGVLPQDLDSIIQICREEDLSIKGLMCIPPVDEPPALHFAFLRKLAQEHGLSDLSMGMSADYERAVALGATYIRVGTGIFGERNV